jgi:hypothetical protein
VRNGRAADVGVNQHYLHALVAKDAYNRLQPSAAFDELCADGMPEPVRSDSGLAVCVEQVRGPTHSQQGVIE